MKICTKDVIMDMRLLCFTCQFMFGIHVNVIKKKTIRLENVQLMSLYPGRKTVKGKRLCEIKVYKKYILKRER